MFVATFARNLSFWCFCLSVLKRGWNSKHSVLNCRQFIYIITQTWNKYFSLTVILSVTTIEKCYFIHKIKITAPGFFFSAHTKTKTKSAVLSSGCEKKTSSYHIYILYNNNPSAEEKACLRFKRNKKRPYNICISTSVLVYQFRCFVAILEDKKSHIRRKK